MSATILALAQIAALLVFLVFLVVRSWRQSLELGEISEQNRAIKDELESIKSETEATRRLMSEQSARFLDATERMFAMRRNLDDFSAALQRGIEKSEAAKAWADSVVAVDIAELRERKQRQKIRPEVPVHDSGNHDGPGAA